MLSSTDTKSLLKAIATPNNHRNREGKAGEQRNPAKCQDVHNLF